MAVASTVLGVLALITCWIPALGLIFSLIALIVAIIAISSKKNKEDKKDLKVIGLVLSILATICAFAITAFLVSGFVFVFDILADITENMTELTKNPETTDILESLYTEYIMIRLENKLGESKGNIDRDEAYRRYSNILMNEYRDLYNKGYDITVDEELKFKLISPEETKI